MSTDTASTAETTCVVTGGASGIGLAVVDRALDTGTFARCAVLDRGEGGFADLQERHGGRVRFVSCDVSDEAGVVAAFAEVDDWSPRIGGLVTCAGVARFTPSLELDQERWDEVLSVNLTGLMFSCREAARRMGPAGGGAIVNLASVSAMVGYPRRLAYSTSKAAVAGLTRTLAVEWAPEGIRVNAVAPGYTRTAMVQKLIDNGDIDHDTYAALAPQNRFGEPSEIAAPIVFLLSDAASFITGVTLPIDGGFMALKVP
ncbi:SDR family oxidoreductase [Baekduia soli]|uniref:SDR family oxidoreductase n=1 Tax=Baekduia soli TaxID=496014 RepID=A0A5B8U4J2_9ACTN|nr:SDR family oxidoreductase [Baekduia soli]QEC47973.1 SDR family oxidoreductase [Baekduia soli]